MRCISSARFNMTATILRQGDYGEKETVEQAGYWTDRQNPETLDIERVWINTDTSVDPGMQAETFKLIARGVVEGGIRVAGTTERYTPTGVLDSADYVTIQFGPNVELSKRDRVYNIKGSNGLLIWKEEEYNGAATVFEVLGVTPIVDPFGRQVENHALLQRAEVQSGPQD